jgi:anti-sigma factor (TIGR02949 family)
MTQSDTISCEDALRLLVQYLDGELPHTQQGDIEHHLERCRSCYARSEFERRLRAELRQLGRDEVQPTFERRIRQLIRTFSAFSVGSSFDE